MSLGTKFQLKQRILHIWTKFALKGSFRSDAPSSKTLQNLYERNKNGSLAAIVKHFLEL